MKFKINNAVIGRNIKYISDYGDYLNDIEYFRINSYSPYITDNGKFNEMSWRIQGRHYLI